MKPVFSVLFGLVVVVASATSAQAFVKQSFCGTVSQVKHACEEGVCNDFTIRPSEGVIQSVGQFLYPTNAKQRAALTASIGKYAAVTGHTDPENTEYVIVDTVQADAVCPESE